MRSIEGDYRHQLLGKPTIQALTTLTRANLPRAAPPCLWRGAIGALRRWCLLCSWSWRCPSLLYLLRSRLRRRLVFPPCGVPAPLLLELLRICLPLALVVVVLIFVIILIGIVFFPRRVVLHLSFGAFPLCPHRHGWLLHEQLRLLHHARRFPSIRRVIVTGECRCRRVAVCGRARCQGIVIREIHTRETGGHQVICSEAETTVCGERRAVDTRAMWWLLTINVLIRRTCNFVGTPGCSGRLPSEIARGASKRELPVGDAMQARCSFAQLGHECSSIALGISPGIKSCGLPSQVTSTASSTAERSGAGAPSPVSPRRAGLQLMLLTQ